MCNKSQNELQELTSFLICLEKGAPNLSINPLYNLNFYTREWLLLFPSSERLLDVSFLLKYILLGYYFVSVSKLPTFLKQTGNKSRIRAAYHYEIQETALKML